MENEIEQKRRVCLICQEKCQVLLKKGLFFAEEKMAEAYRQAEPAQVEYVAGARYLQRGLYCPSVIRDLYLSNASRGRVLRRITSKTKYSHKYTFSPEGKILIAESIISENRRLNCEYLVYEGPSVLGFTYDDGGALVLLSEEIYIGGKIQSYFCASCFVDKENRLDLGITQMVYEEYTHDAFGFADVAIYNISPCIEDTSSNDEFEEMVNCYKYHFIRENGLLIGGRPENSNDRLYYSIPKHAKTGRPVQMVP